MMPHLVPSAFTQNWFVQSVVCSRGGCHTRQPCNRSVDDRENSMAMKPNYNRERAERSRLKQAKAEAKEQEKTEQVAKRRAARAEADEVEDQR